MESKSHSFFLLVPVESLCDYGEECEGAPVTFPLYPCAVACELALVISVPVLIDSCRGGWDFSGC